MSFSNSAIKQLLVDSIHILPDELLRIVKDYVFYDKIQYQSKKNKDDHLHMMLQMYWAVSMRRYIDCDDAEFLYRSKIDNCSRCGEFVCLNHHIVDIPSTIRCTCRRNE